MTQVQKPLTKIKPTRFGIEPDTKKGQLRPAEGKETADWEPKWLGIRFKRSDHTNIRFLLLGMTIFGVVCGIGGCDQKKVTVSSKLKTSVQVDGNVSLKFPSEPRLSQGEGPLRFMRGTATGKIKSLYASESSLQLGFEAVSFQFDAIDEDSANLLLWSEVGPDWESFTREKTLSNGTKVYLAVSNWERFDKKSITVIMIPNKTLYCMTVSYIGTYKLPLPEQRDAELAFHQNIKIRGVREVDFADAAQLFEQRQEHIQKRIEESEQAEKDREEQQKKRDELREEQHREKMESMTTIEEQYSKMAPKSRFGMRRPGGGFREADQQQSDVSDTPDTPEVSDVSTETPHDEVPESTSPRLEAVEDSRQETRPEEMQENVPGQTLGSSQWGTPFAVATPDKSVLVGFTVTFRKWGENDCIESVQPLYRLLDGGKGVKGKVCGNAQGHSATVFAPEGYAVGAVTGRAVAVVDGFGIVFMKIKPDGSLDPKDFKKSKWIGNNEPDFRTTINGAGKSVTKIRGFADEYISSLELVFEQ